MTCGLESQKLWQHAIQTSMKRASVHFRPSLDVSSRPKVMFLLELAIDWHIHRIAYLAKLPYVKRHELPWCACIFPEVCVERRGELARARSTTLSDLPQPGDLRYFLQSLLLLVLQVAESWTCGDGLGHFGPAMLVAIENGKDGGVGANAFLSLKGQLAKCGLEHVRKASSLEQISFGAWEEAVKDVLFPWNRLLRTLSLSCWMKISLNFQFPCSFGLGVGLMPRPAPSDEELRLFRR